MRASVAPDLPRQKTPKANRDQIHVKNFLDHQQLKLAFFLKISIIIQSITLILPSTIIII